MHDALISFNKMQYRNIIIISQRNVNVYERETGERSVLLAKYTYSKYVYVKRMKYEIIFSAGKLCKCQQVRFTNYIHSCLEFEGKL